MIKKIKRLFRVKMPRTMESTVFEIVAAVLIVAMWVVTVFLMSGTKGDVHEKFLIQAAIATVAVGFSLFSAYYPEFINVNNKYLSKKKTTKQYKVLCRMARVLALELVPTATLSIVSDAGYEWAYVATIVWVVLIFVTSMYYTFKARCDNFTIAEFLLFNWL